MKTIWQIVKNSAGDAMRAFFSPVFHLLARRRPPPPKDAPDEMTSHDFEVPLTDAVLRRLEAWGPLLVLLLAGLILLAALWWLSTK